MTHHATREPALIDERIAARYPQRIRLAGGETLTITPMVASDWQLLEQFLSDIPDEDRRFLRHDVSDPAIVERWCAELDYRHILPILAWNGAQVVADATLHQEPDLWTSHVAKMRLLVHRDYRGRGLGTQMVEHVVELAAGLGLHKVVCECASEQTELIRLLERVGFRQAARLDGFVRDRQGRRHDMLLMVYDLP